MQRIIGFEQQESLGRLQAQANLVRSQIDIAKVHKKSDQYFFSSNSAEGLGCKANGSASECGHQFVDFGFRHQAPLVERVGEDIPFQGPGFSP